MAGVNKNKHMLEDIEDEMRERGWYFENRFKKMPEKDEAEAASRMGVCKKRTTIKLQTDRKNIHYMSPAHADKNFLKGMAK